MTIIPMRALATDSTSILDFGVVSVDKINETITDIENEYGTLDKEMLQASEKLEGYFDTVNGVLVINTDVETFSFGFKYFSFGCAIDD